MSEPQSDPLAPARGCLVGLALALPLDVALAWLAWRLVRWLLGGDAG